MDDLAFCVAQLIDHFHLTPAEVGKLTRRQISELFFWPRDKEGQLKPPTSSPERPPVLPSKDQLLSLLRKHFTKQGVIVKGLTDQPKPE